MGCGLICSAGLLLVFCVSFIFFPLIWLDSPMLGIMFFSRVSIKPVDSVPDLEKLNRLVSSGHQMRNFNSCSLLKGKILD